MKYAIKAPWFWPVVLVPILYLAVNNFTLFLAWLAFTAFTVRKEKVDDHCTCGFGGFHDVKNTRCALYRKVRDGS